ncbi:hypothetical protein SAMN04489712_106134 [Thermomonospora echinospora]|uniref:Secreted protein n=1 Tax=Thermomonospora echinospora TaxID=1992 RepID=A0A1H6B0G6_9ACTN|nr:hypothetical protein [Thermomonospora echinospora]SEG54070.1 hypothetical protein SAMN04489712_106134 [Thermomonospora echinospora]
MDSLNTRLAALRGGTSPVGFSARTIAGLNENPGCARRALLDASGADKDRIGARVGFPGRFGQSPFALARGRVFEEQIKANGAAQLLRLLREKLGLTIEEAAYLPLEDVGDNTGRELRARHTTAQLLRAAREGDDAGTLFDHPMLRLRVAGCTAYLEPDLVAFQVGGRFHVVEIKSFAVIDGQVDGEQVTAAARQAAVYVLALRELLADHGLDPETVSHEVLLVTPADFTNRPVVSLIDVRKQLAAVRRVLARMSRVETLLDALPEGVSFDLAPDDDGDPTRDPAELAAALHQIPARYRPGCRAHCELAAFCRDEARCADSLDVFGPAVGGMLGGVDTVCAALGLAEGTRAPAEDEAEIARALRHAETLRSGLG